MKYLFYRIQSSSATEEYVGQTTQSIKERFSGHKTKLRGDKHENYLMQYHCNTIPDFIESLSVEQIGEQNCSSRIEAEAFEREFISQYRSHHSEGGYNNYPSPPKEVRIQDQRRIVMKNQIQMEIEGAKFLGDEESLIRIYNGTVGNVLPVKKISGKSVAKSPKEKKENSKPHNYLTSGEWSKEAIVLAIRTEIAKGTKNLSAAMENMVPGGNGGHRKRFREVQREEGLVFINDSIELVYDSKRPVANKGKGNRYDNGRKQKWTKEFFLGEMPKYTHLCFTSAVMAAMDITINPWKQARYQARLAAQELGLSFKGKAA